MTKTATARTTARLSDGDTLTVKTSTDLVSTHYIVTSPRIAGRGVHLQSIDGHLYLTFGAQLVPISHPDYSYATSKADGARKALAFAVEGAEATLRHAEAEGIPVTDCY